MRNPDIQSVHASVWQGRPSPETLAAAPAHIGHYVIHAPQSHPIWPWKIMSLVTLQDMPGVNPAARHFEGAAYELLLMALDPDHYPPPNIDDGPWYFLEPQDLVIQFPELGRDKMVAMMHSLAVDVTMGFLVPDSDYRVAWELRTQELLYGEPNLHA